MPQFKRSKAQAIADRIRASEHEQIRNSYFLGFRVGPSRHPVLLEGRAFPSGVLGWGPARSHKTSSFLVPLSAQFCQRQPPDDFPVLIIDFKPDPVFFASMYREARRWKRPFKFFTNIANHATYAFNPANQVSFSELTNGQFAEMLLGASGIWSGFEYGPFYFASWARKLAVKVLERSQKKGVKGKDGKKQWPGAELFDKGVAPDRERSFFELHKSVRGLMKGDAYKNAAALEMILEQLSEPLALNLTRSRKDVDVPKSVHDAAIDLADLLWRAPAEAGAKPSYPVYYFALRPQEEVVTASLVGKLVLYAAQNAWLTHRDAYKVGVIKTAPPDIKLVSDEWFHMADHSISNTLAAGGGQGIHFILANQDLSQLESGSLDLAKMVFQNCGTKLCFGVRDADTMGRATFLL